MSSGYVSQFFSREKKKAKIIRKRNKCLLLWIASLPTFSSDGRVPKIEDFKDGVMTSRILKNVIEPYYFRDSLKESTELEQVVEKMKKYLAMQTGQPIANHLVPNTEKIITSGDIQEINRLLQLILSCAVNSQRKDSFIKEIMQMEKSVDLMKAIQEMQEKEQRPVIEEIHVNPSPSEIATFNNIIETLTQQNHDFKVKLSELTEEKLVLISVNERLNAQLITALSDPDPESSHISIQHLEEYKKECERLREENYRLEMSFNDSNIQIEVFEKQLCEAETKIVQSQSYHDEALMNKDEVDSLREIAGRVPQLENSIQLYKKKLDEIDVFEKSTIYLEEQNEKLHKVNSRVGQFTFGQFTWNRKSQMEEIKGKLIETQQSLSQETLKFRRAEFELTCTRDKLGDAETIAERLKEENYWLSSKLEELRHGVSCWELSPLHSDSLNSIDLIPTSTGQPITHLDELENAELKEKPNSDVLVTSDEETHLIVEELRKREAELDKDLEKKTQELVDIRACFEEEIRRLEGIVDAKEEELKNIDNQCKKCMDKGNSEIVSLEPTVAAELEVHSAPKSDTELEKVRAEREMQERLLASAFYNYGVTLHRNAVENRNSTLLQKSRNNFRSFHSSRRKSEF